MSTTEYDVGLFETISALIREQHADTRQNRRGNPRHPYDCVQLLAPFNGEDLPGIDELRAVLCHDLSRCGFSFLANEMPRTNLVIAALGKIPPKFFVAEVLHVNPTVINDEPAYQVGCRFVRRLEEPS